MFEPLIRRAGLPREASLADVLNAVRQMPYRRPASRTIAGTLAEWCGTCSTKHALLAAALAERWPQTGPLLVHRVYLCSRDRAAESFGRQVAAVLPAEGLWDVHRYLTAEVNGRRVVFDVTFPWGPSWDGANSMPVTCGPGTDHVAGADPDADKHALEAAYCDPQVREPFIAALTRL
jgi:hypothetical protein